LQLLEIFRTTIPIADSFLKMLPGLTAAVLQRCQHREQACESIGGDALLVRVGGYQHTRQGKQSNFLD